MQKVTMWIGGTKPTSGTLTFTRTKLGYSVARFVYKAKGRTRELVFLNKYDAIQRLPSVQSAAVEASA